MSNRKRINDVLNTPSKRPKNLCSSVDEVTSNTLEDQNTNHNDDQNANQNDTLFIMDDVDNKTDDMNSPTVENDEGDEDADEEDTNNDDDDEEGEDDEDDEEGDSDYDREEMVRKLKELSPAAYEAFIEVTKEIERTEPNIIDILSEPLQLSDRTKLVHMYEIYKSQQENTDEWLSAREELNKTFRDMKSGYSHYIKYNTEEHERMQKEIDSFSGFDSRASMKYKILQLEASKETKEVIYRKYEEFLGCKAQDDEYGKLRNWLNWATELPHDRVKSFAYDNLTQFLQEVSKQLDSELYGMQKVKEQLLIFLNAKILNPAMKKCNLGLVGSPGVGKTAVAQLVAKVMKYPFEQVACGGISGPEFFKGHDIAYVGSGPGEIVKCLCRAKYKNMIMYLDEYEKVSENDATCAALLGITDPSQNNKYRDLYLSDFTMDLSNIWFIKSMNSPPKDVALRDRIFIINVPGYSFDDKVKILINYVIPKACVNANLSRDAITFDVDVAKHLINKVCSNEDKGVRTIEKTITDLVNKVNFIVTHQDMNGNLNGFKISFDPKQRLVYPLKMTIDILDNFIETKEIDTVLSRMYI